MTRMLLAGMSGWGKSWYAQAIIESNIQDSDHDIVIILDFKDEYRGLCTAGFASHFIVGEREQAVGPSEWQRELAGEDAIVLARVEDMPPEDWQDLVTNVVQAARRLDRDVLVVLDEAHFIAPNQSQIPDEIKGLATTGRGEGASSLWMTQRLTELDTTVISQCNARLPGVLRQERPGPL